MLIYTICLVIGLVFVLGSAIWDFMPTHRRSRGGWIAPGMGSLSGDAGFVASSQGNATIDIRR